MKKIIPPFVVLVTILLFMSPINLFAGPDGNGGDPNPSDVPFDGGITILVATAIGYGIKKARESKNSSMKE